MNETINNYREKVDRRLIIRQIIFVVIIVVLIVISIMNVAEGKIGWMLSLIGFVISTAAGLGLSRMFKIFWHEEKGRVISQLDTVGTVLLVLYIALEVFRKWLFEHWLSGAVLNSFGLIILMGLLLGRFLGTFIKINSVLSENQ